MTGVSGATRVRARSLRALLAGAIDYAGLFPPASLAMSDAVAEYAAHLAADDAWALGRFVVPAGRLEELAAAGRAVPAPNEPWRLSVLVGDDLAEDGARAGSFAARSTRFLVDAVEGRAATAEEVLRVGRSLPAAPERYVEIPLTPDVDRLVDAVRAAGTSAKIRTGGVIPSAFPAAAEVGAFLRSCRAAGIAFKATAGLHHPIRAEYPLTYESGSAVCTMYGFINVLVASALAWQREDDSIVVGALTERDHAAFRFGDSAVTWRAYSVGVESIESSRRHFVRAIGSCSFREPLEGIAALGLA
jgi:hypothetical protein